MLYEDRVARFRWSVPATFNFASDVLDVWAEDRSRVALYWEDESGRELRLTFWDFAERSRRFANALRGLGIGRGDAVMVLLPRVPEWQVAFLGALRLGALVVPCPSRLRAEDVAVRARFGGARAVVASGGALAEVDAVRAECPSLEVFVAVGDETPAGWRGFDDLVRDSSRRIEPVATRPDEPALCLYTSGTTGDPKPVLHGHGYAWAHRCTGELWLDLRTTGLHWSASDPGWASAACGALFAPWNLGVPIFEYDGRFDPKKVLALLDKHGVSTFSASPTEYRELAREDPGGYDLSRLRHCTSAGEPLGAEAIGAWKEKLGLTIHDGYGQTETTLLVANVKGLPVRPGSMGKPFPGHEVRLIDERGDEAPTGEAGEVALRGRPPSLFLGYGNPDGTPTQGSGDWYRTGDYAARDEQGYFWFVGRGDDLIVSSGHRIGPWEVERALLDHDAVLESAVIAIPGPEAGTAVKAFVRLRDGGKRGARLVRELQSRVQACTAAHHVPSEIELVNDLPRTANGKIRRLELRRREERRPRTS